MSRRYQNTIKADPECQECDGTGEIHVGFEATFNVSTMEVGSKDKMALCECAEVIEPDWDAIRDAEIDR